MNQALVHGGQVDVVDFIRRLLDRQRKLAQEARLLGEALEEAITWLPNPQQALPLNAGEFDRMVYTYIARLTAGGSSAGSADPMPPNTSLAVLLQPNFPMDFDAVENALPDYSPRLVAGLRRRAWRDHLRNIGYPHTSGSRCDIEGFDRVLYLVQTDPTVPIMNWPSDTPRPVPLHVLRENFGLANRRRLRVRRPPPRFQEPQGPLAARVGRRRALPAAVGRRRASASRPALHGRRRGHRAALPERRTHARANRRRVPPRATRDRSRSRDSAGPERVD